MTLDLRALPKHYAIPKVEEGTFDDASEFAAEAARYEAGELSFEDFARFRLMRGVYGIRGAPDYHMVRVKIPGGLLTSEQLRRLALIAETYTEPAPGRLGAGLGHVTTRQAVQFHWVHRRKVAEVIRLLAEVGLTTREACSNTVRNVTACHLAGLCSYDAFDIWAYAKAVQLYFLRNPVCQNLPRKFKIAFSGCESDCSMAAIHDVGVIAAPKVEDGQVRRGFRIFIGGGLGAVPRKAVELEEWTPAEALLATCEAVVRVFDRHGNRQNRNAARLKFVIEKLGAGEVRKLVLQERATLLRLNPALWRDPAAGATSDATVPPVPRTFNAPEPDDLDYFLWKETNVLAQRQAGYNAVFVHLPAGDMTPAQMRGLADLADRYGNGTLSTSQTQNIVLRFIPDGALPLVWEGLKALDLANPGALSILGVVGCPGAQTCNLAVTHSHQLAYQVIATLQAHPDLALDEGVAAVKIKISGCPNSCGQHHIADIGLFGNSRNKDGRQIPAYQVLLGGFAGQGTAEFGQAFMRVPAKAVPDYIVALLRTYRQHRHEGESFRQWVARLKAGEGNGGGPKSLAELRQLLSSYEALPSYDENPDFYVDWGADGQFTVKVGRGECAV